MSSCNKKCGEKVVFCRFLALSSRFSSHFSLRFDPFLYSAWSTDHGGSNDTKIKEINEKFAADVTATFFSANKDVYPIFPFFDIL